MRSIYRIVIHYTASKDVSARTIDAWHKARGWKGIGYHKVCRKDGSIENGRPENERGAHAGRYNAGSLGVVLTGSNSEEWYPTEAQYKALNKLLTQWMATYSIVKEQIFFHREVSATSCPGRLDKTRILRELEGGDMNTLLRVLQASKVQGEDFIEERVDGLVTFPAVDKQDATFVLQFKGFTGQPTVQVTIASAANLWMQAPVVRDEQADSCKVFIRDYGGSKLKGGAFHVRACYGYRRT